MHADRPSPLHSFAWNHPKSNPPAPRSNTRLFGAKDESRPLVVRLWYCDIGIKGNVPNWAVREKLLDKFLVGGKPVPERVLEIGRMYKRMADAGYLAKEPGLGSADIAKAHERFLKYLQEAKRAPAAAQAGRGTRRSASVNRA
ncbi:unnamed protein product [Ectocarpus sp. 13 AM-2016]